MCWNLDDTWQDRSKTPRFWGTYLLQHFPLSYLILIFKGPREVDNRGQVKIYYSRLTDEELEVKREGLCYYFCCSFVSLLNMYNRPLNNVGFNSLGPLICGFFFQLIIA